MSEQQPAPLHIPSFTPYNQQVSVLGGCEWSVARLIELSKSLPVMGVPLQHLNVYQTYSKMTLRELVSHCKAILECSLEYPIILDHDGDLMDGRHRIMKAMLEGKTHIKAVRFPENPIPCKVNNNDKP